MKNVLLSAVFMPTIFAFVATLANAGSATWDLNPSSGDWNTAANWTPMSVPNASADTATFGLSNTTSVSFSANTEVNGITFAPTASAYTIRGGSQLFSDLTVSGVGITNNSGITQNFVTEGGGRIYFTNSATAGSSTTFTNFNFTIFLSTSTAGNASFTNTGGSTYLEGGSTAGNATFTNNGLFGGGFTEILDDATAGNATFINNSGVPGKQGGFTAFSSSNTGGNATFINNGGAVSGADGGITAFDRGSGGNARFINSGGAVSGAGGGSTVFNTSAGNGTFTNNAGMVSGAFGGSTLFGGSAANSTIMNNGATVDGAAGGLTQFQFGNGGNSTITNTGGTTFGAGGGTTEFSGGSSAGSATLVANSGLNGGAGGTILFSGESDGGAARVEVFGNGNLDISLDSARSVTVGSIEGNGNVFLGANNLTVGSNNMSTTLSGVIQDGGQNGGTGGSLTKIGSGTLILSGASTYSGNTNIGIFLAYRNSGVLQVDGSIASNTIVNSGGTLAGMGTIKGNVANDGIVSPGNGPGTLTVNGSYTQLSQPVAGTLQIDIAGADAGQFSVLNVLGTTNLSGLLDPVLLNGFVPTIGESFIFLDYGAVTGSLFIFDRNIDDAAEHWNVAYYADDAVLTVAPGNVPVPDHGSTLLLLTLSFISLVMYRRQLPRNT